MAGNALSITRLKIDCEWIKHATEAQIRAKYAEIKRIKKENLYLYLYEPKPYQKKVHLSPKKLRIVVWPNQIGKTYCAAEEAMWHFTGEYPKWYPEKQRLPIPNKGRIYVTDFKKGLSTVAAYIKTLVPYKFKVETKKDTAGNIVGYTNNIGCEFDIMASTQDDELGEGWTGDWVWIDEPIKKIFFEGAYRGLVHSGGRMLITLTVLPNCKQMWIVDELIEKADENPDIEVFMGETQYSAGVLSKENIKSLERTLSKDVARCRVYGELPFRGGLIFPDWEDKHPFVIPYPFDDGFPKEYPLFIGIDWHFNNLTVVLMATCTPRDEVIFFAEHELSMNPTVAGKQIKELCAMRSYDTKKFEAIDPEFSVIDYFAHIKDPITRVRYADAFEIPTIPSIKNIENAIILMQNGFIIDEKTKYPKFLITENCKELRSEIKHFRRTTDDEIDRVRKRCRLNNMMYILAAKPQFRDRSLQRNRFDDEVFVTEHKGVKVGSF